MLAIRLHRREDAAGIVVNREGLDINEDDESRRFEDAGAAYPVIRASYPPRNRLDLPEHLDDAHGSLEMYDGVLIEGALDIALRRDLVIFVTRPLPPADEPLLSYVKGVAGYVELEEYLAAIAHTSSPEGDAVDVSVGFPRRSEGGAEIVEEIIEEFELSDEAARQLVEWSEHGVPIHHGFWKLHRSYEDLPNAQVVVINVARAKQRGEAERFARELRRVFTEEEIAHDVIDYAGARRPPSIYIADLADPRDAVTKKILARIKRCFPPVLTAAEEDW